MYDYACLGSLGICPVLYWYCYVIALALLLSTAIKILHFQLIYVEIHLFSYHSISTRVLYMHERVFIFMFLLCTCILFCQSVKVE